MTTINPRVIRVERLNRLRGSLERRVIRSCPPMIHTPRAGIVSRSRPTVNLPIGPTGTISLSPPGRNARTLPADDEPRNSLKSRRPIAIPYRHNGVSQRTTTVTSTGSKTNWLFGRKSSVVDHGELLVLPETITKVTSDGDQR
jgi:hypothetical protein